MAVKFENECVGCPPEKGFLGSDCPNQNVRRLYCDCCGEETDRLYIHYGDELCEDCLLKSLEVIE